MKSELQKEAIALIERVRATTLSMKDGLRLVLNDGTKRNIDAVVLQCDDMLDKLEAAKLPIKKEDDSGVT